MLSDIWYEHTSQSDKMSDYHSHSVYTYHTRHDGDICKNFFFLFLVFFFFFFFFFFFLAGNFPSLSPG